MQHQGPELPYIEASKKIIKHYNRGDWMKGFETAGYFIFHGVKVVESGTLDAVKEKESKSMESVLHGGR